MEDFLGDRPEGDRLTVFSTMKGMKFWKVLPVDRPEDGKPSFPSETSWFKKSEDRPEHWISPWPPFPPW